MPRFKSTTEALKIVSKKDQIRKLGIIAHVDHGKTTTTVMTTAALASAGLHPTGLAGGRVAEWKGNLRYESDELFVVEADEYDRSFLTHRFREE